MSRERLLLLSLVLLCWALLDHYGNISTIGLDLMILVIALLGTTRWVPLASSSRATWLVAIMACAFGNLTYIGFTAAATPGIVAPLALLVTGLLVAALVARRGLLQWGALGGAAAATLALLVPIWHWGSLPSDVFDSLQVAARALVHGHNPYAPTTWVAMPSTPGHFSLAYIHFQYGPAAALLAVPGYLLGDARLGSVAAMAGLFCALSRLARQHSPARLQRVAALCLALPLTVGMIQSAWTDVYSAAFFAAWLVLRRGHRRWAILALALCLCVKPTILVGLIPFLVWSSRARRELLLAVPAALVVIVPFALATGVGQFLYDVIGVQAAFGNRYDGLDLLSYLWSQLGVQSLPLWLGLLATGIAAVTALARRPRDLADLC